MHVRKERAFLLVEVTGLELVASSTRIEIYSFF